MSEKILIVATLKDGQMLSVFREMVAKAQQIDSSPACLAVGNNIEGAIPALAAAGTATQYFCSDERLELFSAPLYSDVIQSAISAHGATQVWFDTGESSKATAPFLTAKVGGTMASGVTEIIAADGKLTGTRKAFSDKIIEEFELVGSPKILTVQAGVFSDLESQPGQENAVKLDYTSGEIRAIVTEIVRQISEGLDLTEAKRIVGVGRGSGGQEGVDKVAQFAKNINATLGGSRAVIDAGWLPKNLQIGQTGKIISPTLYICVGISGAIQHQAGIGNSKTILAINKDPDAPIFSVADYGIVGNLFDVLPLLEKELPQAS